MALEVLLLIIAIAIGVLSAFASRFRRDGTRIADLLAGATVGVTGIVFSLVVLTIVVGLDLFGIFHLMYLVLMVSIPIGFGLIALPHHLDREYRTPVVAWAMTLVAIVLPLVGFYGTHVVPNRLSVEEVALGATGATRPVVVGVLADLQAIGVTERERDAVQRIDDADPDIVVIAGDLFQLEEDEFALRAPELVGLLRELRRSVDHVIIVAGDADTTDGVSALAEEANITYLADEVAEIDLGRRQRVVIAGVQPPADTDDDDEPSPLIPQDLLDGLDANYTTDDLVLLVSHRPDAVLELDGSEPIDLVISGRTHGGQIILPVIGPTLSRSDVPETVARGGLHLVDGTPIYVSTGVGVERLQAPQLRLGTDPTVGVITIVPS